MKYIIHRKKKIKECDGATPTETGIPVYPNPEAPIGMGPVNPMNGPDRWDMGFRFDSSKKRKKYKIKRRK